MVSHGPNPEHSPDKVDDPFRGQRNYLGLHGIHPELAPLNPIASTAVPAQHIQDIFMGVWNAYQSDHHIKGLFTRYSLALPADFDPVDDDP